MRLSREVKQTVLFAVIAFYAALFARQVLTTFEAESRKQQEIQNGLSLCNAKAYRDSNMLTCKFYEQNETDDIFMLVLRNALSNMKWCVFFDKCSDVPMFNTLSYISFFGNVYKVGSYLSFIFL